MFGFIEDEKSGKLSQKLMTINKKKMKSIDIHKSKSTKHIQRSRYIEMSEDFMKTSDSSTPFLLNTGY